MKHFTSSFISKRRVSMRPHDSHRTSVCNKSRMCVDLIFSYIFLKRREFNARELNKLNTFTEMFSVSFKSRIITFAKLCLCVMQCWQLILKSISRIRGTKSLFWPATEAAPSVDTLTDTPFPLLI
jgi:hypothetical protein